MESMTFGSKDEAVVSVSVMRKGGDFGNLPWELEDGNMIPRLCRAMGEGACQEACRLSFLAQPSDTTCAERNILNSIEEFGTAAEKFMIVSATGDNVGFGDTLEESSVSEYGYSLLPAKNAFFFRPGIDTAPSGETLDAIAMRMADCGSVNFQFNDSQGELVLGQSHFSRTNMRGPSAFMHESEDGQM